MTYFWRVPGCVIKCDRGGGLKLAKNCMTYFIDGLLPLKKSYLYCMSVDSYVLLGDKVLEDAVEGRLLVRFTNCRNQREALHQNNHQLQKPSNDSGLIILFPVLTCIQKHFLVLNWK